MKKNFLFTILAVFLAGLGFGGVSMAAELDTCYTDEENSTTFLDNVIATIGEGNDIKCYGSVEDAYNDVHDGGTIVMRKKQSNVNLTPTSETARNFKIDVSIATAKALPTIVGEYVISYTPSEDKKIRTYTIKDAEVAVIHGENIIYPNNLSMAFGTKSKDGDTIKLLKDITLDETKGVISIGSNPNKNLVFDLNNKKLITTNKEDGSSHLYINSKGGLTIKNGTIEGTTADGYVIYNEGKLIISENAKIIATNGSAVINKTETANFTLDGGEVEAKKNGIVMFNNSTATISNGKITTDVGFSMAGNGTDGDGGYNITIGNGTITSTNAPAIYHPNSGTLTIEGGTIEGSDALYIKAGSTIVNGGTLKGNGVKADYIYNGNGVNPTGDGIVVENADYPGGIPTVTINGGIISSTNNKAIGYYKKEDSLTDPTVTSNSNEMTLTDGWLWTQLESDNTYKLTKGVIVTFKDGDEEIEKQTIANGGNVSEPEDPTKEGNIFVGWFNGEEAFNFETAITADTTLTAHWATALTASTSSIKAASIPSDDREKRNLDKFTVSNSYDATSKTLTVTITDNGMEAYVGGNSETAKKWLGLIADFGAIVNGSNTVVEGIEKYTIGSNNEAENNIDRTDANIYGGDEKSETDFIIWITREDKDGKTIRFVNAAAEDDYVNVKFVFKDKQTTPSYSGGGGSSRSSSKTTTADDTKKAEDTAKTDETKADESKSDESKADETKTSEEAKAAADAQALKDGYSQEFIDAYNFARKNNITTKDTIREADMDAPLTRIAMAKMLSQYAINVLGKTPDTTKVVPTFPDVDAKLDADYNNGVTLAYQLGIMGINVNKYRPFDLVTRAEFGTALSRMLFGLEDGEGNEWYSTHLAKLMEEKIITNNNPNLKELRGYVMIMLMRSAQ